MLRVVECDLGCACGRPRRRHAVATALRAVATVRAHDRRTTPSSLVRVARAPPSSAAVVRWMGCLQRCTTRRAPRGARRRARGANRAVADELMVTLAIFWAEISGASRCEDRVRHAGAHVAHGQGRACRRLMLRWWPTSAPRARHVPRARASRARQLIAPYRPRQTLDWKSDALPAKSSWATSASRRPSRRCNEELGPSTPSRAFARAARRRPVRHVRPESQRRLGARHRLRGERACGARDPTRSRDDPGARRSRARRPSRPTGGAQLCADGRDLMRKMRKLEPRPARLGRRRPLPPTLRWPARAVRVVGKFLPRRCRRRALPRARPSSGAGPRLPRVARRADGACGRSCTTGSPAAGFKFKFVPRGCSSRATSCCATCRRSRSSARRSSWWASARSASRASTRR